MGNAFVMSPTPSSAVVQRSAVSQSAVSMFGAKPKAAPKKVAKKVAKKAAKKVAKKVVKKVVKKAVKKAPPKKKAPAGEVSLLNKLFSMSLIGGAQGVDLA